MSKDAVWSYKVPGVHCAILAEFGWLYALGMFFPMGFFLNETRVIENSHNQLILISLIGLSYYMFTVHFHTLNNRGSMEKEKV